MGLTMMGLTMMALRRLWYRWSWRARYWWLDTRSGRAAQLGVFGLACLVAVLQLTHMMIVVATTPPQPHEPVRAVAWWVAQIIIMVVFAAISILMAPRVEDPKPQKVDAPTVEDGLAVRDVFGTVWIDDQFLLAWKHMGTVKIKKKGGKK